MKFLALPALALHSSPAFAVVTIDYVTVGNAGNAADPTTGYGAVAYTYQIGKYEVTNAQYTAFLNAVDATGANANGIYNTNMGSNASGGITFTSGAASGSKYTIRTSMGDKPVNYVSWYDSARFTNWLHNGQGAGSTETGAYTLSGNTGIIIKNVNATVWLPSENEWYKAAYYDPTVGAGGDNYWLYPTQSDSVPTVAAANATGDISNPGANVANYSNGADWNSQDGNVTTVGSAAANNYYGTADMAGNLFEWNDAVISLSSRGLRGGSWLNGDGTNLRASFREPSGPTGQFEDLGFRVASVSAIPEPSVALLGGLSLLGLLRRRR
jgi:formylglycine-generating enzyme required for sulfatase activity